MFVRACRFESGPWHQMNISNFIEVKQNIIPKDLSNILISHYEEEDLWRESKFNYKDEVVDTEGVAMEECWIDSSMMFYHETKHFLEKEVIEYSNKHQFMIEYGPPMRLNKYGKGGYMQLHYDAIRHSHGQQYGYPHITILSVLNDNFEGGEFFLIDKHYNLKNGDCIIFPSNFIFKHKVKEVTAGVRYSLMAWLM